MELMKEESEVEIILNLCLEWVTTPIVLPKLLANILWD